MHSEPRADGHAGRGAEAGQAKTGAVAVMQRTSSDLRLNPHLHVVFLDGAYREQGTELAWEQLEHLGSRHVGQVLERAVRRMTRLLRRRGALAEHGAGDDAAQDALEASAVSGRTPPAGPQWLRGLSPLEPPAPPPGRAALRADGISLVIPPLRERRDEIPGLSQAFIAHALSPAQRQRAGRPPRIDAEATALLARYSWPGNIRELRNVIERAVLLSGGADIALEHLPVDKMGAELHARGASRSTPLPPRPSSPSSAPPSAPGALMPGRLAPGRAADGGRGGPPPVGPSATYAELRRRRGYEGAETIPAPPPTLPQAVAFAEPVAGDEPPPSVGRSQVGEVERQRLRAALEKCAGNQTKAARVLGMSRRTLVTRLETYALPRPRKDASAE
ncbi:MAG: helix-turn-helix domain-containing protein [Polyangiaceae bacterium]